jgi:hypothetical protein
MTDHPKLFVSYSHDNQEHKEWVKKISTDLRQHMGVDVIFDQWDLRIGGDLALYMEQGLSDAALVLCVCSEAYVDKANSGVGGSGYEKMIMTQSLLKNTSIDFILPIIRNNADKLLPAFLGAKLYIDFTDDKIYLDRLSELTARIYNEDIAKKPPLGEPPFSDAKAKRINVLDSVVKSQYHNPKASGNASFDFSNNSGNFTIGTGEYEFVTSWSKCGSNSIYAYKDDVIRIGYLSDVSAIPDVSGIERFDFTSRVRTVCVGEVVIWQNGYGHFAATKVIGVKVKSRGVKNDELSFEYKIYD